MKIFLDTANLDEIREGMSFGVIDGITTNPTLVAKEKRPFREHLIEICNIVKNGEISAEVVSTDTASILREAREIATWHPNIIVKLPTIPDGVRALSILSKENIRVNMTLVFSSPQALLVAKAGAYFVSPFLGRLDDISADGLTVLREIMDIYQAYKYSTQVLAASLGIRSTLWRQRGWAHTSALCPTKSLRCSSSTRSRTRDLKGSRKIGRKRAKQWAIFFFPLRHAIKLVEKFSHRLADRCWGRGHFSGRWHNGIA